VESYCKDVVILKMLQNVTKFRYKKGEGNCEKYDKNPFNEAKLWFSQCAKCAKTRRI